MNDKTILVVDDESHILHVVSLKLQNAGFKVLTAGDADEAFDVACGADVHLIITDYQMPPGPNGLEFAARIHKEVGKRDIPMILLTAHGLALDPVELSRSGIACCLSKPFSPREVLGKVNSLLESAEKPATATAEQSS